MSEYKNAVLPVPRYVGSEFADMGKSDGGLLHAVGVKNYQVMRANRKNPEFSDGVGNAYNHAPDITYFYGTFWIQYLSTPVNEHEGKGCSFLSRSENGSEWEKPVLSFPPLLIPAGKNRCIDGQTVVIPENTYAVMHQRCAFYCSKNGRLLTTGFYGYSPEHRVPWVNNGIGRVVREIYPDGSMGKIYFIRLLTDSGWDFSRLPYESYEKSDDGGFVDACRELLSDRLYTQQWAEEHGNRDEYVSLKTHSEVFGRYDERPYEAFATYHIDEKTVVALWKQSVVGVSRDGGESWEIKRETSFATSGGKAFGTKTSDGKYLISYVNSLSSEHRYPLVAVTSENGLDFDGMVSVFGHTPPRRFEGLYKDFGPQYVRGIGENCPDRPKNVYLCHSVNKEDIWVTEIPVPLRLAAKKHSYSDFSDLSDWNIYSGKWASVKTENGEMILSDCDPCDGAVAEKIFPESVRVKAEAEISVGEGDGGELSIELCDGHGFTPCRLMLRNSGLFARYTSVEQRLCDIEKNKFYKIALFQDCEACDLYVTVNGEKYGFFRNMQKVNSVCRLVFRTKAAEKAPGVDVRPLMPDIENGDEKAPLRVYTLRGAGSEAY